MLGNDLVAASKNSQFHVTFACSGSGMPIVLLFQDITTQFCTHSRHSYRADKNVTLLSMSVQNKFQTLPVEDNWEKGIRKEFKPFSSEIFASQVSLVLVTSFRPL